MYYITFVALQVYQSVLTATIFTPPPTNPYNRPTDPDSALRRPLKYARQANGPSHRSSNKDNINNNIPPVVPDQQHRIFFNPPTILPPHLPQCQTMQTIRRPRSLHTRPTAPTATVRSSQLPFHCRRRRFYQFCISTMCTISIRTRTWNQLVVRHVSVPPSNRWPIWIRWCCSAVMLSRRACVSVIIFAGKERDVRHVLSQLVCQDWQFMKDYQMYCII